MRTVHDLVAWLRLAPPGTHLEAAALVALLTPLEGGEVGHACPVDDPLTDLTVEQLAKELGRSPSTLRGWLAQGAFPNAARLRGREWRIPRADVRRYLESQKRPAVNDTPGAPLKGSDDLGSWRTARKAS